ncbi:hypothetical protein PHO31112_04992 [Pandoraea horticolens]|uniref:Putative auto-transporter adhesin head GIN domain-containing protein n=1 Tax=Pandoraea horticolens TaxID=2508298 RepID=A0A5E4Z2J4_9BURK|nr:DUF2807 domain-containing protein [Pandoraea horticolens]VVE55359.1 hypothetical protein PHO31112_04992 [Pandoraea horticolens]
MDIFRPPATSDQKDSAWERIENYVKEERPLQLIRKIVVKGAVDVVFRRCDKPMLIVAGEMADAVASVKTYVNGGKLVIEREGMTISFGNSHMTFHGSVGSFVMGDIVNGKPMGTSISQGKVVVGVALPEAPAVKIKGSGDVTLLDLRQAGLDLEIEGSGDITAYGQVAHLEVEIAGSGDILVRGNPPHRDHSVAGSGKIKFRQEVQHDSSNQSADRTRTAFASRQGGSDRFTA